MPSTLDTHSNVFHVSQNTPGCFAFSNGKPLPHLS